MTPFNSFHLMKVPGPKNNSWKFDIPAPPHSWAGAPVSCQITERGTPVACEERHYLARDSITCPRLQRVPPLWRVQRGRGWRQKTGDWATLMTWPVSRDRYTVFPPSLFRGCDGPWQAMEGPIHFKFSGVIARYLRHLKVPRNLNFVKNDICP